MIKLGTVENVIHDGTILLNMTDSAMKENPPHGARVYDQRGSEMGRVVRVFGPAKEPYVSLRPAPGTDAISLLGTSAYLDPEERPEKPRTQRTGRSFSNRGRRPTGPTKKKGVKGYRRKEKQRKK